MSSRIRLIASLFVLAIAALALALPGLASAKDRNHDKIPDKWEKRHDLSLKVKQTKRDQDKDGLKNRAEFRSETDPHDADSDNDGVSDGAEGAGAIASFDASTGKLTINAFDSADPITGTVTDSTEIKCDNGDDQGDEDGDHQGGDEDHSGPSHEGDDDQGDDVGDDDRGSVARDHGDDDGVDEHAGEDGDDDSEHGDDQHNCSVDNLVEGAVVQEAELSIQPGTGLTFEEIELAE
jgi:hypothetical protein